MIGSFLCLYLDGLFCIDDLGEFGTVNFLSFSFIGFGSIKLFSRIYDSLSLAYMCCYLWLDVYLFTIIQDVWVSIIFSPVRWKAYFFRDPTINFSSIIFLFYLMYFYTSFLKFLGSGPISTASPCFYLVEATMYSGGFVSLNYFLALLFFEDTLLSIVPYLLYLLMFSRFWWFLTNNFKFFSIIRSLLFFLSRSLVLSWELIDKDSAPNS